MNLREHDFEPVRGLPAPLPKGEAILWQGAPTWEAFAKRAMRVRVVAVYFLLLAIWGISGGISAGVAKNEIALSTARLIGLGAIAICLLVLFAYLVARTTIYTITTRRVLIRYGIALPMTMQIAFKAIDAAGVHVSADGSGDIALGLLPGQRIAYLVMWPHVRPWKMLKAEPTLRGIPDVVQVAQTLGRALAASAEQPAKTVLIPVSDHVGADDRIAAAV